MPGRKYLAGNGYRYGFNAQEKSDEISESGNGYTAPYWEYDTRIGKRWNTDPKPVPWESNYAVNGNNPLFYVDPLGDFKSKFGASLYKFFHGGKVGYDKLHKEWYVGKKIEYEGKGVGVAIRPRFDWNGSSRPYNGSGWGHDSRSLIASTLGINGKAGNLFDLGLNSVFQNRSVQLTGGLLERVKQDPDIVRYENWIVRQVQASSTFKEGGGVLNFTSSQIPLEEGGGIQLGGDRGSLNPFDPSSVKTWKVGFNPLTWAVRTVEVRAQVFVNVRGAMHITYTFTDNFDLRPERDGKVYFGGSGNSPFSSRGGHRPWEYNAATSILGVPYHDVMGGNDKMKITATWTSNR
jgi:hypothetical protein